MRLGQWLADGKTRVAVSDATGEERIVVFDAAGERTLDWDIGRVLALRAAPAGTCIALTNHRNEVWIGDVATGEAWLADRSDAGRSDDIAWSPDGRGSRIHSGSVCGTALSNCATPPHARPYW